MDASDILVRANMVTYQVVDGQAILLDLSEGTYFSLNSVGTDFWESLDGQQSIAQHATVIASDYSVDYMQVIADLLELAEQLSESGLVRTIDQS